MTGHRLHFSTFCVRNESFCSGSWNAHLLLVYFFCLFLIFSPRLTTCQQTSSSFIHMCAISLAFPSSNKNNEYHAISCSNDQRHFPLKKKRYRGRVNNEMECGWFWQRKTDHAKQFSTSYWRLREKNNSFKAGNNKKENEIQKRVPINWKTNSGFFSLTNCVNRRDIKKNKTKKKWKFQLQNQKLKKNIKFKLQFSAENSKRFFFSMPSIAIFRGVHQLVERVDTASIFGANFKLFHVIGDSRSSSHFLQKRPGLQSQPLQIFLQFHHIRWTDTALLQPNSSSLMAFNVFLALTRHQLYSKSSRLWMAAGQEHREQDSS